MQRRHYIVSVSVGLLLAGCTSNDYGGPIESSTPSETSGEKASGEYALTETEGVTDSETPTEPETPTGSGNAEIAMGKGRIGIADFDYAEYPYYEVEITNQGDAPSGLVDLVVDWFDESGSYIDDTTEELVSLKPDETWIARSYNILNDNKVDSAEGSGSYDSEPAEWPDGLEVTSSKLLAGEENVKVRATVENNTGRTIDYVAFYGKLYDGNGKVLGQVWTNETDLTDGSSWRAEREWDDKARAKLVESHEVVLGGIRPLFGTFDEPFERRRASTGLDLNR